MSQQSDREVVYLVTAHESKDGASMPAYSATEALATWCWMQENGMAPAIRDALGRERSLAELENESAREQRKSWRETCDQR